MSFLKKAFYFLGGVGSFVSVFNGGAFSSSLQTAERNFPYQSMVQYRETARDLLFARNGTKNLPSALLREKRYLAGNQDILQKIDNLEKDLETSSLTQVITDKVILNLLDDIKKHCRHEDENLEVQEISLSDKLAAVDEIVTIYQSFLEEQSYYKDDSMPFLRFWQRVAYLLSLQIKQKG